MDILAESIDFEDEYEEEEAGEAIGSWMRKRARTMRRVLTMMDARKRK